MEFALANWEYILIGILSIDKIVIMSSYAAIPLANVFSEPESMSPLIILCFSISTSSLLKILSTDWPLTILWWMGFETAPHTEIIL